MDTDSVVSLAHTDVHELKPGQLSGGNDNASTPD